MMNNNPMQMIQAFYEFKRNFKGDPQQEVQKLLQSGRMTQAQLNDLQAKAAMFQQMMNGTIKR